MSGILTAPLGVSTTTAIGRRPLRLRRANGIIISEGGQVTVLHLRTETGEEVRILPLLGDLPHSHPIREGGTMDTMEGEGVLEEDMGQGTEGDFRNKYIPLQVLRALCEHQLSRFNLQFTCRSNYMRI